MWTKNEDAQILKLWPSKSAAQIGMMLGKTRNAVIGRYHRLSETRFPYEARKQALQRARRERRIAERTKRNHGALSLMHRAMQRGASRDQAIKIARKQGASLRAIAADVGVSYQRIQQVMANAALTPW